MGNGGLQRFDPVGGINQSMCARVAGRLDGLGYGATIVDAGSDRECAGRDSNPWPPPSDEGALSV